MMFGQRVLLNVPPLLLGLIMVGGWIFFSIAGLAIVRKFVPRHRLKGHHDVAGPIFATVGVVYAVLLAFMVIMVWENYERCILNVEKEVYSLVDLYRDAESFDETTRQQVRGLIKEYKEAVLSQEWKTISLGQGSLHVDRILDDLWSAYSNYTPRTEAQKIFLEESVSKLNELSELRTSRLIDSRNGIHPLLWLILILGGITTIAFTFFFGADNLTAQTVMAVLLAILISLILLVILLLDFPFSGGIRILPDAFNQVMLG